MADVMVLEFQNEYPVINLDLMKNNSVLYDLAIIVAHSAELKRGFITKRQNKTTKKGTKFTYKPCMTEEEFKAFSDKMHNLMNEFKAKHSVDIDFNANINFKEKSTNE